MLRAELLRSTSVRLAGIFGALFIAAFVISSFVAVQQVRAHLHEKLDRDIAGTYAVLSDSMGENDLEDLIHSVETHAAISVQHDDIFLLTDRVRTVLAGNVGHIDVPVGWSTATSADLGLDSGDRYRIFAGDISGYRLAIGKSYSETDQVGEIVVMSFVWAVVLVLIGTVAGAAVLALRLQRRMAAIAGTMAKVSEGDLKARIPRRHNGDDIDVISGQINNTLDRLTSLFEGMKQVSADIAHDLKTPLNRLKFIIQGAISRQEAGLPVGEELDEADAQSDRINATFDALLRIAQIEAGARKSRFAPVSLSEIAATIAEVYTDVASEEGKTLCFRAEIVDARILGDRELLLQMFANLVENAMHHCLVGTTIVVSLEPSTNGTSVVVADNGHGIPEEERANVLRRLYRLEKSRTTPGSGLGLSLVKAIAELHGAILDLSDNRPGLRVAVTFPASPAIKTDAGQ